MVEKVAANEDGQCLCGQPWSSDESQEKPLQHICTVYCENAVKLLKGWSMSMHVSHPSI